MAKNDTRHDDAPASAPSGIESSTLVTVSALMEERRRFEGWIATLEAKREATPERVFARVHADYTTRLEGVLAQLTAHAGGLRAEMDALTGRLSTLDEERLRAQDARAESELRAHVGELSAKDWEQTAATSDAELAGLSSRHKAMAQELTRTRELLAEAERPVTPPAPAPAQPRSSGVRAAAAAGEGTGRPSQQMSMGSATAPELAAEQPEQAKHPEQPEQLEITHHTPPPGEAQPAPAAAAAVAAPEAAPRVSTPPRASRFDELAFLSSVVDTPSGSIDPGPSDRPDEKARRDSFAMHASDDAIVNLSERRRTPLDGLVVGLEREEQPLAAHVSGSMPLVPRDKSDGTKTLKCSECSAMNYPTEWYCERCGAELASL